MTDYKNAERLRAAYLANPCEGAKVRNICRALPNWNGCDYCDTYSGAGLDCWKQGKPHNCCHCERVNITKEG